MLRCSEPEAEALLELAKKFRPHVWMNAHSGMEALFMPYDHLPNIPSGEVAQATLQVCSYSQYLCPFILKRSLYLRVQWRNVILLF